ncbi:unnamed protein product [Didymodactylos carnosus]|uniref:Tetratricopeptide repeat protein n=1 Tax=Didymodactylos carnosus TaxID=1234261 RepID=A0A8S2FHJ4_9BILA|nr:unnamed protein product [Didymodactylos carnosus]CAF4262943.1 unnamed protein product [Didymodactylos carnosus]
MGSVFRISSVDKLGSGIWIVKLVLNGDEDIELRRLIDHTKKEIQGSNDFFTLGSLLMKMGEHDKAEEFYLMMLKTSSLNDRGIGAIYNKLGLSYWERRNNAQALLYYNKSLDIYKKCLPAGSASLATVYAGIGAVYKAEGDLDQALMYMQKALKIQEKSLLPDDPGLATMYNNRKYSVITFISIVSVADECNERDTS